MVENGQRLDNEGQWLESWRLGMRRLGLGIARESAREQAACEAGQLERMELVVVEWVVNGHASEGERS